MSQIRAQVVRSLVDNLENICCESSVGKAFNASTRLDEIIQCLLASHDDALHPIGEKGSVREGVPRK